MRLHRHNLPKHRAKPVDSSRGASETMRQGRTLMIGIMLGGLLLVRGIPGAWGQANPIGPASQSQDNAPAKTAAAKSAPAAAKSAPTKSAAPQASQKAT